MQAQLHELWDRTQAKILEHSHLLKVAESSGWEESAVDKAEAAWVEVQESHKKFDELLSIAEERLVADGYTFPEEQIASTDEPPRWAKSDLTPDAVPVTGEIENALESGLQRLIDRLPPDWFRRQQELIDSAGYGHLRESVMLYGGVSGKPADPPIHRYAYGIALALASHHKRDDYDIYEGALLVPLIAALCTLLDPLAEVQGGYEKLDELPRAPSSEIDSRIYELAVAARCAALGRRVSFIRPTGSGLAPDLRIHDLTFPSVIECKMQSRLSDHERREFRTMQDVFRSLVAQRERHGLVGALSVISNMPLERIGVEAIVAASLECTGAIDPYQTIEKDWGTISFDFLSPSIELEGATRIYSPDFLGQVFDWSLDATQYDGICAIVANNTTSIIGRAELPFCIRWRSDHEADWGRKARSLASQLSEAWLQVPAGEAGFVYLSYEETHRNAIADGRTDRILALITNWEIRRRGINPQLIIINRLYPSALHEGRPNLIESAIPLGFVENDVWSGIMPRAVFVESANY